MMNALGRREGLDMLISAEKENDFKERILTTYKAMSRGLDAVVIEGIHEGGGGYLA